jgi:hypothetical protein
MLRRRTGQVRLAATEHVAVACETDAGDDDDERCGGELAPASSR